MEFSRHKANGHSRIVDARGDDGGLSSQQQERRQEHNPERRRSRDDFYRIALGDIASIRQQAKLPSEDFNEDVNIARTSPALAASSPAGSSIVNYLFQAYEEAAKRVAQRLHDECDQMLATVYIELGRINRSCDQPTAEKISHVVDLLDEVSDSMRQLSRELRPPVLDEQGLLPALRSLAQAYSKRSGVEVAVTGYFARLPQLIEVTIYRVVQEALSNAVRHAECTRVEINLSSSPESVSLSVRDNGVGFIPPETASDINSGLGLIGIYERVSALTGECTIVSCRRSGTHFMELQVDIPL